MPYLLGLRSLPPFRLACVKELQNLSSAKNFFQGFCVMQNIPCYLVLRVLKTHLAIFHFNQLIRLLFT